MISSSAPDTWHRLEFRHIVALDAVARSGTFGQAALELGYTQSAVSQQVASLERIVGEKLIERPGPHGKATLTEAGATLLRHAEAITARLAAARADIAALRAGDAGSLSIGTYQSVGARLLPAVVKRFHEDWPAIRLQPVEPPSDRELFRQLESGQLDLAFCSLPAPDGPFDVLELMSDPYILLVPLDSPFATSAQLSLEDVSDARIIGCAATGARLVDALRASGHSLEFAFRSDSNSTLQELVASGFGVALIPQLAVAPGDEARVRVIRLTTPIPPRRLAVAWHRDRQHSRAVRAFVEVARVAGAELHLELARDAEAVAASSRPAA